MTAASKSPVSHIGTVYPTRKPTAIVIISLRYIVLANATFALDEHEEPERGGRDLRGTWDASARGTAVNAGRGFFLLPYFLLAPLSSSSSPSRATNRDRKSNTSIAYVRVCVYMRSCIPKTDVRESDDGETSSGDRARHP